MLIVKKYIFLFFACISLIVSAFFAYRTLTTSHTFNRVTEDIQTNFNTYFAQIEEQEEQLVSVINKQSETPLFSDYKLNSDFTYRIYKDDSLVFWSDNKAIPFDSLHYSNQEYFLQYNNKSTYIIKTDTFNIYSSLYTICWFLPIHNNFFVENDYLKSGFNTDFFPNTKVRLLPNPYKDAVDIYAPDQSYLFSLSSVKKQFKVRIEDLLLFTFFISLTVLLVFLHQYSIREWDVTQVVNNLKFFLLFAFIIRCVFYLDLPLAETTAVYNQKPLNPNWFFPSVGGVFVNLLFLTVTFWYLMRSQVVLAVFKYAIKAEKSFMRPAVGNLLLLLSVSSVYLFALLLTKLNTEQFWFFDITKNLEIDGFKLIYLVIYVLIAINYFIVNRFVFLFITRKIKLKNTYLLFFLIILFISILVAREFYIPFIIHGLYFLVTYFYRGIFFNKTSNKRKYSFYTLTVIVCSLYGGWSVYTSELTNRIISKKEFAQKILKEGDYHGEYLLNKLGDKIKKNSFVKREILSPLSNKKVVSQVIKKSYLEDYFDKYTVKVNVFDAQGNGVYLEGDKKTTYDYVLDYSKNNYETTYPDLYFISRSEKENTFQYVLFIPIEKNNVFIGDIIIELYLKRIIPSSIYPKLLLDKKFQKNISTEGLSYAIFNGDKLQYSLGDLDYNEFKKELFSKRKITENKGVYWGGYHHLMVSTGDLNHLVVSHKANEFKIFYSNYSFCFILLVFFLLILLLIRIVTQRFQKMMISYSSKVQLYYNIAFFLPLFIVSVALLSVIDSFYKDDIKNTYKENVTKITRSINTLFEENKDHKISVRKLGETIESIAQNTGADINLFDTEGNLLATSQPLIYESSLLSKKINSNAFIDIIEKKKKSVIEDESIGDLEYQSFYTALIPYSNKEFQGIVSVPFFNGSDDLKQKRTVLFTTVVNIFSSLFILLLLLSYLTSKALTDPLNLISKQIQKLSFRDKNEPLSWKSNDEIGVVVKEYNQMIKKLEESKKDLEESKKEEAWREMAQQVAHEIKNPLTPMKLTLQHLRRVLSKTEVGEELSDKSINTLLSQIETLSDIATSFSTFAKMPIPKSEKFDIIEELNSILNLYRNTGKVDLIEKMNVTTALVEGDRSLMGRIFTNLILNAIQSVPKGKPPLLEVSAEMNGNHVMIGFRDNGTGIPEEIQKKVFVPNFSTKYEGSGLGLAVAKRGVNHAHGDIWFDTSEKGTTFFVKIPCITDEK
ncbi:MAG: ATP-binding protein [Cyclobacteriaceae bacterium]